MNNFGTYFPKIQILDLQGKASETCSCNCLSAETLHTQSLIIFVSRSLTKFHITLCKSFKFSGSINKNFKKCEIPISCITVYKYVNF